MICICNIQSTYDLHRSYTIYIQVIYECVGSCLAPVFVSYFMDITHAEVPSLGGPSIGKQYRKTAECGLQSSSMTTFVLFGIAAPFERNNL